MIVFDQEVKMHIVRVKVTSMKPFKIIVPFSKLRNANFVISSGPKVLLA